MATGVVCVVHVEPSAVLTAVPPVTAVHTVVLAQLMALYGLNGAVVSPHVAPLSVVTWILLKPVPAVKQVVELGQVIAPTLPSIVPWAAQ